MGTREVFHFPAYKTKSRTQTDVHNVGLPRFGGMDIETTHINTYNGISATRVATGSAIAYANLNKPHIHLTKVPSPAHTRSKMK